MTRINIFYLIFYLSKLFSDTILIYIFNKIIILIKKYRIVYYIFNIIIILIKKYRIVYYIAKFVYMEYLSIFKGKLSINMVFIIGVYGLYIFSYSNLILLGVIFFNSIIRQYLSINRSFKLKYPNFYLLLLDITLRINICLIIYFMEFLVNWFISYFFKLLHSLILMCSNYKNNGKSSTSSTNKGNNQGNNKGKNQGNNQKPKGPKRPCKIKEKIKNPKGLRDPVKIK